MLLHIPSLAEGQKETSVTEQPSSTAMVVSRFPYRSIAPYWMIFFSHNYILALKGFTVASIGDTTLSYWAIFEINVLPKTLTGVRYLNMTKTETRNRTSLANEGKRNDNLARLAMVKSG